MRGFWKILKPRGTLLFDARNYDYILSDAKDILKDPESNFKYLYETNYLGKSIVGFPVEITDDRVHFVWKHCIQKQYAELELWPATLSNIHELVKDTLGDVSIEVYFDYQKERPNHYDFAQYVLRKE